MVKGYRLDNEARVADEHYALVYAPALAQGRARDRFPENCVQVVASAALALASADRGRNLYAARVIGPARSSEGLRVYYLVRWLTAESGEEAS